ncbi:MAG: Gfo/Idh/MocA family oxidoreductase [Verrucomicrobia bacterium]|nr:Gfo/Idh/MocA family oxidoreductase [Verrucomicrobiota bacterium]
MNNKLQWGVIGTGAIARVFAEGLRQSNTGTLAAIGSRSDERAATFAQDFPAPWYNTYEALLADPRVQAVYISTPHPAHAQWAIRAAEAGKHVLCEKPLAMNRAEAQSVIDAARRNGVFLMEGFMYRCHPQTMRLVELIRAQTIGEIKLIRATFSFCCPFDPKSRLLSAELGGGGILDVGCYCVSMARLIAGAVSGKPFEEPVALKGMGHIGSTGVDEYAVASLRFSNAIVAQIAAGVQLDLENNVRIVGTEGSILVPSPWTIGGSTAGFSKILIFKSHIPEEIVIETDRGLYALEADHVAEQIALGRTESPLVSWDDSLGNMRALDLWRREVEMP